MPIDVAKLTAVNQDYDAVMGKRPQAFVCPITLQDEPGAELCEGHILNKAIETAARATVIQRKDVDGYYGRTIEPELIRFLNTPVLTAQQILERSRELKITLPSGETDNAFTPGKKARKAAREKFQQIDLLGRDGEVLASPFLRTARLEPSVHKGLQVECLMSFNNAAMLGSLLKSGYLAFFRLLGYQWVQCSSGDRVRRALASFYAAQAGKERAGDCFSAFDGAFNVFQGENAKDLADTVTDGVFWLHSMTEGHLPLFFAQTALFRVNERMIAVTLPATPTQEFAAEAYSYYEKLLKDRTLRQRVYAAQCIDQSLQYNPTPVSLVYAQRPQPGVEHRLQ